MAGTRSLARFLAAGSLRGARAATDEDEISGPTTTERVLALRAAARTARAEGDVRLALRQLFLALFLGLGERGDLRYHDAWTNRELLRRGPCPGLAH